MDFELSKGLDVCSRNLQRAGYAGTRTKHARNCLVMVMARTSIRIVNASRRCGGGQGIRTLATLLEIHVPSGGFT